MCGIMGFVKTSGPKEFTSYAIRDTFRGIQQRGTDAAGFSSLRGGITYACKHHVPTTKFAEKNYFKSAITPAPKIFIGHARAATNGTPYVNTNNHPFWTKDGRYHLVHNGVILEDDPRSQRKVLSDCDSEILLRMVEKDGVSKAFRRACAIFKHSWFAVLLMDTFTEELYFFRESAAPGSYSVMHNAFGGTFIASTPGILTYGLGHLRKEDGSFENFSDEITIHELDPYTLYKFSPWRRHPEVIDIAPEPVTATVTATTRSYGTVDYSKYQEYAANQRHYYGRYITDGD